MSIDEIIEDLHTERQLIDQAIDALERLGKGRKRRGRPPNWTKDKEQESISSDSD